MKDKSVSFQCGRNIFKPNLGISFGTTSPLPMISGPSLRQIYSWAGSPTYTSLPSLPMGTIYRWRHDPNDPLPLNLDQWVLWSSGNPEVIKVVETPKESLIDHWSHDLPQNFKSEAEPWVDELIKLIVGGKNEVN